MKSPSESSETGRGWRVLAGLVIATAAAAVTAGMAMNNRHPIPVAARSAEAGQAPAGAASAGPVAPLSDPSLPSTSAALRGVPSATAEPAPTF
jgi:hypothetical protein